MNQNMLYVNTFDTLNVNKRKKLEESPNSYKITLWEYITSFVHRTKGLKEKIKVLEIGTRDIDERLDVINILKKMREIDKIRALLFDRDQLVLFNNLPKPEIDPNIPKRTKRESTSHQMLKKSRFLDQAVSETQVWESYERIRSKEQKTVLDEKLLKIFNETTH